MINKNIKAQHEIVGFVLIVLVVSIIGLVFLTLSFAKESERESSIEISNLLSASMYYTTDCVTSFIPQYKNINDLVKAVHKNPAQKCLGDENVSEVLQTTLKEVIDDSLRVDESSLNRAYTLRIYYQSISEEEPAEEIMFIEEGNFVNCSSRPGGTHLIDSGAGTINIELDVCRGIEKV